MSLRRPRRDGRGVSRVDLEGTGQGFLTVRSVERSVFRLRLDSVKSLIHDWSVPNAYRKRGNCASSRPPSPTDYFITRNLPTTDDPEKVVSSSPRCPDNIGPYARPSRELEESRRTLMQRIGSRTTWNKLVDEIRKRCGGDFDITLMQHRDPRTMSWK
jgi:hypothetical protein